MLFFNYKFFHYYKFLADFCWFLILYAKLWKKLSLIKNDRDTGRISVAELFYLCCYHFWVDLSSGFCWNKFYRAFFSCAQHRCFLIRNLRCIFCLLGTVRLEPAFPDNTNALHSFHEVWRKTIGAAWTKCFHFIKLTIYMLAEKRRWLANFDWKTQFSIDFG